MGHPVCGAAEEKQIPPLRCGMTSKKVLRKMTNKKRCGMTTKKLQPLEAN
jgi:hypothetical protein